MWKTMYICRGKKWKGMIPLKEEECSSVCKRREKWKSSLSEAEVHVDFLQHPSRLLPLVTEWQRVPGCPGYPQDTVDPSSPVLCPVSYREAQWTMSTYKFMQWIDSTCMHISFTLKDKFVFLHIKSYYKDISDHTQCSTASLWWTVQSQELELLAEATAS